MFCVICPCHFRDYDKKSKAICADHPYSKRKAKDDCGEKSDQENDSSADEAPAAKKVKVDTRMVTNQRTGVPVTGSSASDDSCQSQPAKTPPYSAGSKLPSTPTPTAAPPIASTMTKPEKSSTPFSMVNILRDVINKDLLDEGADGKGAKDTTMPPTQGGILSKLDELDNKDKEKKAEGTAQESASEDNARDISVEIIDFIITDALKICEIRKRKISMQILDGVIDNAIDQSEERRKKKDAEKKRDYVDEDVSIIEISDSDAEEISKNAQKQRDVPADGEVATEAETMETQDEPSEKNEDSENLAKALLQELKELSGETGGAMDVEEKPVIIQDAEEAEDAKIPEEEKPTGGDVRKTNAEETKSEEISQVNTEPKEEQMREKVVIDDVISIDDDDDEIETEEQTGTTKHDNANNKEVKEDDAQKSEKDEEAEDNKKDVEADGTKDDKAQDEKDEDAKGEKDHEAQGEKDIDAKDEKDEDVRDDTSQDSTAEALERLTSELMFLNESLYGSASESVPDSTNVEMEWEVAEEKLETVKKEDSEAEGLSTAYKDKPSEPQQTLKEPHLKKELVEDDSEMSGNKRQTEGVPDAILKKEVEEQPRKTPESRSAIAIVKEQTQALSVIGMEYASSVTSESDVEDRISSSWIKKSPLAKILESSKESDRIERKIRQSNEQMIDLNDGAKSEKEVEAKQTGDRKENVADKENIKNEEKINEKSPTTGLNNDNKDKERTVDAETGEAVKSGEKETELTGKTAAETVGRTEEAMDTEAKEKTEETKAQEVDEDKGKDVSKKKEASQMPIGEEKESGCSTNAQVEEKELFDLCLKGLTLCLKRFPQHFKSLYRMAYVYYHSKDHRVSPKWNKF